MIARAHDQFGRLDHSALRLAFWSVKLLSNLLRLSQIMVRQLEECRDTLGLLYRQGSYAQATRYHLTLFFSHQELELTLYSLNADIMEKHRTGSQCNSSVESLRSRLDSVTASLETYFGIDTVPHSAVLTPRPTPGEHMLGDITQLVVASSNLLRIHHILFNMDNSISDAAHRDVLERVLNILTVSTLLATDRKGLKFSVSQIAEYVSNFRYVDPSGSHTAQKLIYTLGRRYICLRD